jgi:sugar/nucleoside kinase (ribokinase family)
MKTHQLLSVGSWAPFDHLFRMSRYPQEGETITVMTDSGADRVYYGDCSINLAYAAARLGIRTALATIVGHDFDRSGYRDHLLRAGIDLDGLTVKTDKTCGHNYIYFDDEGKGFCFSLLGAAEDQEDERVPDGVVARAEHVAVSEKFSGYTLAALREAKQSGARTYINGMVETADRHLHDFLSLADVLFINESEFGRLMDKIGGREDRLFGEFGLSLVFVTLGSRGSRIIRADGTDTVAPVKPERKVDTTGAGDAFAAGAIAAMIKGYPPRVAAQVGATVSSFVIEDWGCQTRTPDWESVAHRYRMNYGETL